MGKIKYSTWTWSSGGDNISALVSNDQRSNPNIDENYLGNINLGTWTRWGKISKWSNQNKSTLWGMQNTRNKNMTSKSY